jgi:hypothetical protein
MSEKPPEAVSEKPLKAGSISGLGALVHLGAAHTFKELC